MRGDLLGGINVFVNITKKKGGGPKDKRIGGKSVEAILRGTNRTHLTKKKRRDHVGSEYQKSHQP